MDCTDTTEPQCLYSRDIPLLPPWAVRPVQSPSACTRVHFFTFATRIIKQLQVWAYFNVVSHALCSVIYLYTRLPDYIPEGREPCCKLYCWFIKIIYIYIHLFFIVLSTIEFSPVWQTKKKNNTWLANSEWPSLTNVLQVLRHADGLTFQNSVTFNFPKYSYKILF
jgi:hypothetical protein